MYILSDLDVPKEHQNPFLRPLKPNKNPKIGNLFPPKKKNKKTDPLLTKKLTPHRGGRGRVWGLKTPTSSTTTTASTARTTTTTTPTRPPSVKNPQLPGRENAQNAVAFQEEDQEQRSGQLRVVDNPSDPLGKILELFFYQGIRNKFESGYDKYVKIEHTKTELGLFQIAGFFNHNLYEYLPFSKAT